MEMSSSFHQICVVTVALFSIATITGCDDSAATANAQVPLSYASRSLSVPVDISYGSIDTESVVSQQRQLNEICRQLSSVEREVTSLRKQIVDAESTIGRIPREIDRLNRDAETIGQSIPSAKSALAKAREVVKKFSGSVSNLKRQASTSAEQTRVTEYNRALATISRERKERNELRSRIGARPEDQSEVQKENLRRREAQQITDSAYDSAIRREFSAIDSRLEKYVGEAAASQKRVDMLKSRVVDLKKEVANKEEALRTLKDFLAIAPSQLEIKEREVHRLNSLRNHQESTLLVTRRALNERIQANTVAREIERVQSAARSIPVSPQGSSTPTTGQVVFASGAQFQGSASTSGRLLTTRYYDRSYRPAVGSHYVRGHVRRNGTYVSGHLRTDADGSYWNNWSSRENVNPVTGKRGSSSPRYGW
jgi:peptidoglycan hydrolase CwlO-like protein